MSQPFLIPIELFRQTSLFNQVAVLVDDFEDVWTTSPHTVFPFGKKFSIHEQQKREIHLAAFIKQLEEEQHERDARFDNELIQERIFSHVRTFFKFALGFSTRQLDLILSLGFKESTKEFVRLARQFDSTLTSADLFQACRNVWIMNGLQLMLGLSIKLTPSIFAYSMLYPYTDNYLDDVSVSKREKIEFNDRFAQRLAGEQLVPSNSHEEIIFSLVYMIENDFERIRFPQVFESLLAIHQAQTKSVLLLESGTLTTNDVLRISLEKGGTSVLADGYLVAGHLTMEQARFMFGYGAYLQFLDDLQDVHDDAASGQRSIYTIETEHHVLDLITNQTFHFGEAVLNSQEGFSGKASNQYSGLMRTSIRLMMLEAAGFADDLFSSDYIKNLNCFSPFRFSALKSLKKRHAPYYASMFGKLI